ncbi:putative uncharacterized protein DDB_G0289041 [Nymphalis io]|uniref:putative uncharacterized protein DDB_G0289041 n=1 Tax=Inachis io TaxID=171585 RepID=UPI00216782BC|nr:putative uncharacterized protein DDB_G0289041 [Nymphalis io]
MEFSDDSFIWSDASNDSDTMEFDIKQEESDNNKDNLVEDKSHGEKKKTKKRKHEEPKEVNGTVDSKPKLIKSEPDSDFDTPRKKKKKKHHNSNKELQESDYDDSYLNYKVKQEQVSFLEPAPVKTKNKKKHKKNSESLNEDLENTRQEVDTSKHSESSQIDNKLNVQEEELVEKKKKKKSKKNTSDTIALNDDFDNSDNNFQAKKKLKKKKHEKEINNKSFDQSEDSQIEENSCINSSTLDNNFIDDDHIKENSDCDLNNESTNTESKADYAITSDIKPSKQISKILDRLRFEDEDSIDSEPKENDDETNFSKHLKKFFENNKKLSLITPNAQTESVITEDDEVWIISGPHELNVKDFKGKHIKIDTKCKLKFKGQSYDSVIDNCTKKAPILSYNKNKLYVKNFPIINSINLRKRIPKAHIPEENVITNNQINFIPLPETKCRHPLFGINYRKATKIAPSINERLNNAVIESSNGDKEKRKKHKKEKRKVEIESDVETKPFTETIPMESAKKKRKRKSSTKDEHVAKKAKYKKNEPDSTDVWESEQAIEKNLFDF